MAVACAPRNPAPTFSFDPRLDLLGSVALYAAPEMFEGRADLAAWRERFAPYAGHPAVALLRGRLAARGGHERATRALLMRSEPPALTPLPGSPPQEDPEDAALAAALGDFARASDFMKAWRARRFERDAWRARLDEELRTEPTWRDAAAYTRVAGVPAVDWRISAILPQRFAINRVADGGARLIRVRGLLFDQDRNPRFGFALRGSTLGHEWVHAALDPRVEAFAPREAAQPWCADAAVGPIGCLIESVTLAVDARLVRRSQGAEAGDAFVEHYAQKQGFWDLPALYRGLERFEAQGAAWKDLGAFYPEWVGALPRVRAYLEAQKTGDRG